MRRVDPLTLQIISIESLLTWRGFAAVKVEVVAEDVREGDLLDLGELDGAELNLGVAVLVEEPVSPLQAGKLAGYYGGVSGANDLEKSN